MKRTGVLWSKDSQAKFRRRTSQSRIECKREKSFVLPHWHTDSANVKWALTLKYYFSGRNLETLQDIDEDTLV